MIDVKQAVKIAREEAEAILSQSIVNLEEIERVDYQERDVWAITLSFPRNLSQVSPVASIGIDYLQYKRFLIDVESGELVAMKLREFAVK